ncbi:PBP1A family penicillin-binding protein [Clostridium sp. WLY-B-L2]|uniref:Penicillin-binding protein 1A n=1 Tax=Clostridium aromativorans TaxID=2836848 RepID=A0ABS8N7Y4_9CLOT|nr:PBP1A family penicillin-binding protein [Clostridium aromativorans]MCC9295915.1 PBP1A family penicillin-binding protein [Clostridium aromativorans]
MVKRHKKTQTKTFKKVAIILSGLLIIAFIVLMGISLAIIKNSPKLDVNQILNLSEPSVLYDDKDELMDAVVTPQQRTVIPFSSMPQNLKNAFVSIEDERFYTHKGIDLKRLIGVIFIDIKSKFIKESNIQGASTITQQLVRSIFLSPEVSYKRKLQEIYLSLQLEQKLSKDQILEAYMNTIFLGGRALGVEAASKQYFGKPAKDLNLIQCAFIAGMPQSPSVYYPYSPASRKNPSIYLNRTATVIKKMYENGYISQPQYTSAINDISTGKLNINPQPTVSNGYNNEWFTVSVINSVKKDLKAQYHYSDDEIENLLMYDGLKIHTTMNKNLQQETQNTLDNSSVLQASSLDKNGIVQPQASAVVMDYHSGEVKALVGGRGTQPARSFNRAASENYLRPSGSSIKPLTVYGPAIDSKKFTAASIFEDSPLSDEVSYKYTTNGEPYQPKDDTYIGGNMTLRTAITHSINLVAVKLEDKLGLNTAADYAEKFGITLDNDDRSSIAALSLGELHHGVNTLIMSAAYGVFGNSGTYTSPKLYTKVEDRNGKILLENKTKTKKVLSPQAAYIMYDMLKGPVSTEGTAPSANIGNMPVRGKTGTSSDSKNLWFCGLTPYYSAAVWIGNDDNTVLDSSLNSNSAAKLWANIMSPLHKNLPVKDIKMPSGVVAQSICSESGKLPVSACYTDPEGSKVYTEFFISGTVPTEKCDMHRSWNIFDYFTKHKDKTNNNKSTDDTNTGNTKKDDTNLNRGQNNSDGSSEDDTNDGENVKNPGDIPPKTPDTNN